LVGAQRGFLDDIIDPDQTRKLIIDNLKVLEGKQKVKYYKKHDNLPL